MQYARYRGAIADHAGDAFMNPCMAATYEPAPRAPLGFRIPFNAETGEVIAERWCNWRRHDPIDLVSSYKQNLKSLRGITIDCGWRDQYHVHYGSRLVSQRLADAGIKHRYEEFDDDHSDTDYHGGQLAVSLSGTATLMACVKWTDKVFSLTGSPGGSTLIRRFEFELVMPIESAKIRNGKRIGFQLHPVPLTQ